MNDSQRRELIATYRRGYQEVAEALKDIHEDELDASASGEWTPRQIAHHLADSEMTSAIRLRRLIAEDQPVIAGYDEEEFAMALTRDRPIHASLEAMRWARESTADILDRLSEEEWKRTGTHSESGPYSVERWLEIYAKHAHDHAAQVLRSRGRA